MTKERMEEIEKRIKDTFACPKNEDKAEDTIACLKKELLKRGFEYGKFYDYESKYMIKDVCNIRLYAVPEKGNFMIGRPYLAADVVIYNTIYYLWQIKYLLQIYGLSEEAKNY